MGGALKHRRLKRDSEANVKQTIAKNILVTSLTFGVVTVAQANCIQGSDGAIYSCGGSPAWDFETGRWTCVNPQNGKKVAGERVECDRTRGRDAGTEDDLLEPLVPDQKGRRAIPPGDPRQRRDQPK